MSPLKVLLCAAAFPNRPIVLTLLHKLTQIQKSYCNVLMKASINTWEYLFQCAFWCIYQIIILVMDQHVHVWIHSL